MTALFETRGLEVHFRIRGRTIRALDGVDLEWRRGEVLGLVGESGCGKSTLGRTLLGLERATGGELRADGAPVGDVRALRRRVQMVFQDPYQSLNPKRTVGQQVTEGLVINRIGRGVERIEQAVRAMAAAGLSPADRYWDRYPHELSGGQRQRVVIASAMALEPEALICDEPVSALDVSVRAQVLQTLADLRRDRGLSMLFITHDVGLAWALCDRVAVMYLGRIVEQGATEDVLVRPRHPYTRALLSVVPTPQRRAAARGILAGELPDAGAVPPGCRFHPRCPVVFDRCPVQDPRELIPIAGEDGHGAACWLAEPARATIADARPEGES